MLHRPGSDDESAAFLDPTPPSRGRCSLSTLLSGTLFVAGLILFSLSYYMNIHAMRSGSQIVVLPAANRSRVTPIPLQKAIENARLAGKSSRVIKYSQRTSNYERRDNLSWDRIRAGEQFHIEGRDVMVFLHVQKTGGTTLERHLTRHLDAPRPCECQAEVKKCRCLRPGSDRSVWLFSRFSTGWACGLHADWTELVGARCVDNVLDKQEGVVRKRRYFYVTILRDPMTRLVSEFRHVRRGATWPSAHMCDGRPPSPEELPHCYTPQDGWDGVSLDEFLACPYNLAFDRQTRMLADLSLVGCYNRSAMPAAQRDAVLLASAKRNLHAMAFFGLLEDLPASQTMFERTFGLRFTRPLTPPGGVRSKSNSTVVNPRQRALIRQRNKLDQQLYAYAKQLFYERWRSLGNGSDPS